MIAQKYMENIREDFAKETQRFEEERMNMEFKDLSRAVQHALYHMGIKDVTDLENWVNSGKHIRNVGPERLKEIEKLLGRKIEYNGAPERKNNYVIQLTIETSEYSPEYAARCRWSILPPEDRRKIKGEIYGLPMAKKINKSLAEIIPELISLEDRFVRGVDIL